MEQTVTGLDASDRIEGAFGDRDSTRPLTFRQQRSTIFQAVICALSLSSGEALGAELIELGQLGTGGFHVDGLAELDSIGYSVSSAGDVNEDGLDDVILGAPVICTTGPDGTSGTAYVVFGKADALDIDLANLSNGGFRIAGKDVQDRAGGSVAGGVVQGPVRQRSVAPFAECLNPAHCPRKHWSTDRRFAA